MIVCICRRVSDKSIRAAIDGGAQCLDDVKAACRAGTGCGACHPVIEEMLAEQADCPRLHLKVVSPYLQTAHAGETA